MDIVSPDHVVDLGAGAGTLSVAAAARWKNSKFLTVDVDASARAAVTGALRGANHTHIRTSALNLDLPERIRKKGASPDAGVCNPPFILPRWRRDYVEILRDAGFDYLPSVARDIEAPALFLAQNMRILAVGGTLGIILPDSLISADRYRWFREGLLANYRVLSVLKLPRNSFKGTDALAHVVTILNERPSGETIHLSRLIDGAASRGLDLSVKDALERLDVDYHLTRASRALIVHTGRSLESIGAVVNRGTFPVHVAVEKNLRFFHTTDIRSEDRGAWIDVPRPRRSSVLAAGRAVVAEPGDILLARVGRNFAVKVIGVRSGSAVLTDCVYRIRVAECHRDGLLKALASADGAAWLNGQAHGVSATQLPKSALMQFSY